MVAARHSFILAAVVSVSLAVGGLGSAASADESGRTTYRPHKVQPDSVARGLIVKLTTNSVSSGLLKAINVAAGPSVGLKGNSKLSGKISTIDFNKTVPAAVAARAAVALTKRGDVVWAIPNTMRRISDSSPVWSYDPLFGAQRNLWDANVYDPDGGYSIKVPRFWQKTMGSPEVVVAVVDTGIRAEHPDLQGQLVDGYDMIDADQPVIVGSPTYVGARDGDGRDADPSDPGGWTTKGQCGSIDGEPYPAQPSSWHGTFVAGEIAAKSSNQQFIAGAAPGVKVQPVRVISGCVGWDSDILAGITWASGGHVDGVPDNATPADVVNLSLGGLAKTSTQRNLDCVAYADVAAAGRARGSVFVAAAGNDYYNANLEVPASCSGYISVGATSLKGFSSTYSNIGSSVDLVAPGGDTAAEGSTDSILSLVNSGTTVPVLGGSTYRRYEGTSMAAPEVAAGAALLYSSLPSAANDQVTADRVRNALFASITKFRPRDSHYANKAAHISGSTYYFDLNCAGHDWCGRGYLDLSTSQASISGPVVGPAVVGETLTADVGTWVTKPTSFTYQWVRDGVDVPGATGPTHAVLSSDVGAKFSVRVGPVTSAFSAFTSTSPETEAVPQGPDVVLGGFPAAPKYGVAGTATVTISAGGSPVDGPVELRRGTTTIATGNAVGGTATLTIDGTKWIGGTNKIRAAFLGNGTDAAISTVPQAVVVGKATSTISSYFADATITKSTSPKSKVTIKVVGDTKPIGIVRVYDGSKYLKSYRMLASYNGVHWFTLPKITKVGKHSIRWKYAGNGNITGKTSAYKTLTIR